MNDYELYNKSVNKSSLPEIREDFPFFDPGLIFPAFFFIMNMGNDISHSIERKAGCLWGSL